MPVIEGCRCDLVLGWRPPLRVQCKWGRRHGDVIRVRIRTTGYAERICPTKYTADEIDALVAYCADLRKSLPLADLDVAGRNCVHLRLAPHEEQSGRGDKMGRAVRVPGL